MLTACEVLVREIARAGHGQTIFLPDIRHTGCSIERRRNPKKAFSGIETIGCEKTLLFYWSGKRALFIVSLRVEICHLFVP